MRGSVGVCEGEVIAREFDGLRVYLGEISDPEACLGNPEVLRKATVAFQQVLRGVVAQVTPIPFPFPTLLEGEEVLGDYIQEHKAAYCAALQRLGNTVQYELTGSWASDAEANTAVPISGREFQQRHQQTLTRVAALDAKLKTVTGNSVREWKSRQDRKTYRWFALVERDERERFLLLLRSAGPSEGVRLRLSGPWPPNEFTALEVK